MRMMDEVWSRRCGGWVTRLLLGACVVVGWAGRTSAQGLAPAAFDYPARGVDELRQLVAPVALYPDALLAQVLAASTYPDDVIAAARWEDAGNDPRAADAQPWDSSVAGVARYPSILHYMASNGDWMNDLGDAFINQREDVMSAVQDLRGEALAAGTLVSTAEQTVINQDGYIQIILMDPQYLYAPIYDPRVVYVLPTYVAGEPYRAYVTFGPRVEVGEWLDLDCDWHDRVVYTGRWSRDRPWWHDRDRGGVRYLDVRPGVYRPGRFNDVRGRPIEAPASHWARGDHRPPPRRITGPAARPDIARPERGYPGRESAPVRSPIETPRGGDVVRQSERGKVSRERAANPEPRATPQPAGRAPVPAKRPAEAPRRAAEPPKATPPHPAAEAPRAAPRPPAPEAPRAAPRRAAPAPPEARPSAPTRGGAMGGYQNGAAASHSAERGSASQGKH